MCLYIGLLHYPVYNKNYQIITSAITNFDLHDISRVARTYGVKRFFIITPLSDQQRLADAIRAHWTTGYGARYNRYRKEAVELTAVISSLDASLREIAEIEGKRPVLITTDALRHKKECISYPEAIRIINSGRPVMLLFGTAWGLDKTIIERSDFLIEPIEGCTGYNHLSVRTAAAIILDRLMGREK